jgi:pyruvate dehydrogenase (quinone)
MGVGNSSIFLERRTELMSQYIPPITPSITLEMAKGFALYIAKSVFNRRRDDLIGLPRANMWH